MATPKSSHSVIGSRSVIPHVDGSGQVRCTRCGGSMSMVAYKAIPSGRRWWYWKCDLNHDHITAALPTKRRRLGW